VHTSQDAYEQAAWAADAAGQHLAAHRAALNVVEGWESSPAGPSSPEVCASVAAVHRDAIEQAEQRWLGAVGELRRHELIPGVPLWRFLDPHVAADAMVALSAAEMAGIQARQRAGAAEQARWPAGSGYPAPVPPPPAPGGQAPEVPGAQVGPPGSDVFSTQPGWPYQLGSNGAAPPGFLTPGSGRFTVEGGQ
jgi:hypothetical protein